MPFQEAEPLRERRDTRIVPRDPNGTGTCCAEAPRAATRNINGITHRLQDHLTAFHRRRVRNGTPGACRTFIGGHVLNFFLLSLRECPVVPAPRSDFEM